MKKILSLLKVAALAPLKFLVWLWLLPGKIFGRVDFTYTKPEWIDRVHAPKEEKEKKPHSPFVKFLMRVAALPQRFLGLVVNFYSLEKEKPGKFWLKLGGTLAVIAALFAGIIWVNRPQPDLVTISVNGPAAPRLEEGAGIPAVTLSFSGSASRIDLAGKNVTELVRISPEWPGSWTWSSDRQMVFLPEKTWTPGENFTVDLDRTLFREGINLQTTQVKFTTPEFRASRVSSELYTNPRNPRERRILATLSFNYPIDPASLQNAVSLTVMNGKNIGGKTSFAVDIAYDKYYGKAFITGERMDIPSDTVGVQLKINGGLYALSGDRSKSSEISTTISVPGVYDFVAYQDADLATVRNDSYEYERILNISLTNQAFPSVIASNLKVWVLPKDRIGIPGMQDRRDYSWSIEEIDSRLLGRSQELRLEILPIESDAASLVSFRYTAPSKRILYVEAKGELTVFGEYKIRRPMKLVLQVPEIPRSVSIMSQGALLSLGGERTLSVVSNDLKAVQIEINRLLPDQVNHLVTQASGDLAHLSFRGNNRFNEDSMSAYYQERREMQSGFPGQAQYTSFDFSQYLERTPDPAMKYGLFLFRVKGLGPDDNPSRSSPTSDSGGYGGYDEYSEYSEGYENTSSDDGNALTDSRFILVTDLGILSKLDNRGRRDIYVQDIRLGIPRSEILVKVLGKNGLPVFSGYTDVDGHILIPDLSGFSREQYPVVITAESFSDFSFLPISASDRQLNYSRFDIGGVRGATRPETLNAYLFSDRGIYRPGDAMNIGYILKSGDWGRSLADLPLEVTILDARGSEVLKKLTNLDASGFDEVNYRTFDYSPAGTYQINLSLVKPRNERQLLGSTTVRVEEFQPDRLTVNSFINGAGDALWMPFANQKVTVSVMNLYGIPASGNRVNGNFRLTPRKIVPRGWRDYVFLDTSQNDKYYEEILPEVLTDDQGKAEFNIDLSAFEPGTYQLTFQGDAMEKSGGRRVTTETLVTLSAHTSIVGYKADGSLTFIRQDSPRTLNFVAVDALGRQTSARNLKVQVDEIRYVSVLNKDEDGAYRYRSVMKKVRLTESLFEVGVDAAVMNLNTAQPGTFEVRLVQGGEQKVMSVFQYTVAGRGNLSRSLDRNAELEIVLDKTSYSPGEQIQLQIKAPYTGSGVITIERERVYSHQWFTTDTTTSIQTITVPDGIEGTAYVNVAYIRGIDSKEIYTSPLSYGVVPFRVNLDRRAIGITLDSPDQARPGEPFTIRYSTDRNARIVVFAVDEGILQVAGYQTPRPLDRFFQKQALEVSTSQILDLILPEFSLIREAAATGGSGGEMINRNLNPFKRKTHEPVAFWSGLLRSSGETRSVSYTVPSWFNGTMRIMAVAVAPDAIGVRQRSALIRSDFIMTPTLPLFVAPNDEFKLGVTVTNNSGNPNEEKEIRVAMQVPVENQARITPVGPAFQTVRLKRQQETTLWFTVKAGELSGEASVVLTARSGSLTSTMSESLSVRPPVIYRQEVVSGIQPKGNTTLELDRRLQPQLRKQTLSLSYLPLALTPGLLGYLEDYPYGCSEQLLSQSFPIISLARTDRTLLARARTSWDNLLNVLRARQNNDGSIGTWAANEIVDPYIQAYAAHYLLDGAALGFPGGDGIKERLLTWIENFSSGRAGNDRYFEPAAAAYGIYVLTLNQKVTTNLLTNLVTKLDKDFRWWREDITGLYVAGTYALLKKDGDYRGIMGNIRNQLTGADDNWYRSSLLRDALYLYMLARYSPAAELGGQGERIQRMAAELKEGRFTTLSAVFAIQGFQSYSDRVPPQATGNIRLVEVLANGTERPLAVPTGRSATVNFSADATRLKVENGGSLDMYWQLVNSGFEKNQPAADIKDGVEVQREYRDGSGRAVTTFKRGEEYTVVLRLRSLKGNVTHLVVTDLLPGGTEVILDSENNQSFDKILEGNWDTDYAEAREDRVLVMTRAGESISEARYRIRAINSGTFVLPSVSAQAMYNRAVRSETAGGRVTIQE